MEPTLNHHYLHFRPPLLLYATNLHSEYTGAIPFDLLIEKKKLINRFYILKTFTQQNA